MESLPNEILIQVLERFPIREVLQFANVCKRFYALVSRVHYARLAEFTLQKDHELILECYQPSAKISTPYMFCDYIATDGFEETGLEPTLRRINDLYSRFQPVLGDENRRPRARYPRRSISAGADDPAAESPSEDIHLDGSELFLQLCTVINFIKLGPRRGLFLSHINVIESVVRVFRDWLSMQAEKGAYQRPRLESSGVDLADWSILWTDESKHFGLRFHVTENQVLQAPILVGPGDESPVSYTLEYKELLVRSNQLVLAMERSKDQQHNFSSRAIILAPG